MGPALASIRDGALTHKTFESYCQERWSYSKSRTYQLIDASAVQENVPNWGQILPTLTEAMARELAKAPVEDQAEVWESKIRQKSGMRLSRQAARKALRQQSAKWWRGGSYPRQGQLGVGPSGRGKSSPFFKSVGEGEGD